MDELLKPILTSAYFKLGYQLCGLFFIVFTVALIFWTWRDADRRGAISWFWAVVVLFFNVVGWAIYMVVRPPEFADDAHESELEIRAREAELRRGGAACPSCLKPIEPDYLICPYCMKKLKKPCVSCGKSAEDELGGLPVLQGEAGRSASRAGPRRRRRRGLRERRGPAQRPSSSPRSEQCPTSR